jgi:hypothetical protein
MLVSTRSSFCPQNGPGGTWSMKRFCSIAATGAQHFAVAVVVVAPGFTCMTAWARSAGTP